MKGPVSPSVRFEYRAHGGAETAWRVWRTDWGGDMFEVLTPDDFTAFVGFCEQFGLTIRPASED